MSCCFQLLALLADTFQLLCTILGEDFAAQRHRGQCFATNCAACFLGRVSFVCLLLFHILSHRQVSVTSSCLPWFYLVRWRVSQGGVVAAHRGRRRAAGGGGGHALGPRQRPCDVREQEIGEKQRAQDAQGIPRGADPSSGSTVTPRLK